MRAAYKCPEWYRRSHVDVVGTDAAWKGRMLTVTSPEFVSKGRKESILEEKTHLASGALSPVTRQRFVGSFEGVCNRRRSAGVGLIGSRLDGGGNGDDGDVAVAVKPVMGNGRGLHRPLCRSRHRRQHGGALGRRTTRVGKVVKPPVSPTDGTPTMAAASGGASRGWPARALRQVGGQWVISRPWPPTDTCPQCRAAPRTRLRPG